MQFAIIKLHLYAEAMHKRADFYPPLADDELREVAAGIYYTGRSLVAVDQDTIGVLKDAARSLPVKRARLCAHPDPACDQHDMLIVSHRDTYVAPHRHLTKSETMLVLEGEADAYLFDEAGSLDSVLPMGSMGSGRTFFYRMPAGRFHSLRITSELLVFVESTLGPFRPEDSELAGWAPPPDHIGAGHRYMQQLSQEAEPR